MDADPGGEHSTWEDFPMNKSNVVTSGLALKLSGFKVLLGYLCFHSWTGVNETSALK